MTTRPKAIADDLTFQDENAITGNVLGNDVAGSNGKIFLRFFNGDNVLAKKSGQITDVEGEFGTFHVKSDGSFTYTLNDAAKADVQDGQTLNETVIYKVSDASGNTSQSSLNLTIGGKTGPVAVNDEFTGTEGTAIAGNILANDTPGQNGKLLLRSIADQKFDAAHTTIDVQGEYGVFHVSANGEFTYDLTADLADGETVNDTIRYYKVSDGAGNTDSAKITLTITGTDTTSEGQSVAMRAQTDDMNSIQMTGVHQGLADGMGSDHGFMS